MSKYNLKPMTVEAITYNELLEYGKKVKIDSIENGYWTFKYNGCLAMYMNHNIIIYTPEGTIYFIDEQVLVTYPSGKMKKYEIQDFNDLYEKAD